MTTVLKTWRSFRRLTTPEKFVVLEAATLLAITWLGLRLAGFRRWKIWIERSETAPALLHAAEAMGASSSSKANPKGAACYARLLNAAARHFPVRTNCLENALALYWLMRRHRIPAALRMGARKVDGRLEAHAWLEAEGIILDDSDPVSFVPFSGRNVSIESQIR